MKAIITIMLVCSLFSSCATKADKQTSTIKMNLSIPNTLKTSPSFKLFCRELTTEMQKHTKNGTFKPSKTFQQKYSLKQSGGLFYIRGFIHVNELFEPDRLNQLTGSSTEYTEKIRSFTIPLNQLPGMLQLPGIIYLELSQKVNILNN